MRHNSRYIWSLPRLLGFAWLVAACGLSGNLPSPPISPQVITTPLPPTETPTPIPPSPTPVPLAVSVNGEEITLEEYQAEVARFAAALEAEGIELEEGFETQVLDDLINQVLLAQGAGEAGLSVDEASLQTRLEQVIASAGGQEQFTQWMAANGYNQESFTRALERGIAAAWIRDRILASVPETVEQVHARQILLYNSEEAEEILAQIKSGKDFATLAATYDPVALGDLGWFPKEYLTVPELEEAAFGLQPDEYSEVIETRLGFHIIQVIERDPNRPLDSEARLVLQEKALREWLEARRQQSEIQVFLPERAPGG